MRGGIFQPDFRAEPYCWTAAPPEQARDAPLPQAIVGSGFAGLSAALDAARAGASVAVLDSGALGGGASSRSGGMVSSGQKLAVSEALPDLPAATAQAALQDSKATFAFLQDLVARERLDCDLILTGRFFGAFAPAHFAILQRNAATLAARTGVTVLLFARDRQHAEVASDYFHGGFVVEEYGGLHPAKLNQALRARMRRTFPQLAEARISRAWGGFVAVTADRLPHVAEQDGVLHAVGCNGNGVALKTWLGWHAAQLMLGRTNRRAFFADIRFPALPLAALRPLMAAVAGAGHHLRDFLARPAEVLGERMGRTAPTPDRKEAP